MQKIATRIFIAASLAFGVLGILMVIFGLNEGGPQSELDGLLVDGFVITIFIVLPSFALSVAGKYLKDSNEAK